MTDFASQLSELYLGQKVKQPELADIWTQELGRRLTSADKPLWPDEYVNSETGKVYQPHNDDEADFVYTDEPKYYLCKGGEGDLRLDTQIPTPAGFISVGDIQVGDDLFDEYGNICQVTSKSQIFTDKTCYRITFDTGETIECSGDHLWVVETYNYRKSLARRGTKRPEHSQAKYHLEVLDTKTIYETQRDCYKGRVNYSIRLAQPIQLPEQDLPIHPYILGSWLGDGSSYHPQVTCSEDDSQATKQIYQELGYRLEPHADPIQYTIYKNRHTIGYRLKELGLLQNKHIPMIYLRGSIDQRLALLQGLMDTDGYIDEKGNCEFTQKDENLINQVRQLLLSLGIKCSIPTIKKIKLDGKTFTAYRLFFNPNIQIFRLPRKAERINHAKGQQLRKQRIYLNKVEIIETTKTQCISVNSPNRVFLCGEGFVPTHNSGKTVAGIIKTLNRLRRGMSGALISPDLPHFKKSLWPEFRRWCPWEAVIEKHRYRAAVEYEPKSAFQLVFISELGTKVTLYCGGIGDGSAWEGPNLSFIHFDEAQRKKDATAFQVLTGRIRIPGPKGELPQIYLTTIPVLNWLYEYFGPPKENDPFGRFKEASKVITLKTSDNLENLADGYFDDRAAALTGTEKRRRLDAEWVDTSVDSKFLPDMQLWYRLKRPYLPLTKTDELILAVDAGVSDDSFAILGVTRDPQSPDDCILVRYMNQWLPPPRGQIDFMGTPDNPGPELELRRMCEEYNVLQIVYDPYQLISMMQTLERDQVSWVKPFHQGGRRALSDKHLLDLIVQKRIYHHGDDRLTDHIRNADRATSKDGNKLRIVKRTHSLKVDLAVCLSMASYSCLYLNL